MAKDQEGLEDKHTPIPLTEAQRTEYQVTLAAEPKDGKKYSDDERAARTAAKQALLADEDPKARFKRLSQNRLNAALDMISLIGNLCGPNYEYTEAQVQFIRDHLIRDVNKAMDRFKPKDKTSRELVEIPE